MAGVIDFPPDEEAKWAFSLGYFIWSMAQLEWQTYEWGNRIGGAELKDKLIDQTGFSARHAILMREIAKLSWPENQKTKATTLWGRAKCFSRFRNLVAHNPVIMSRQQPGTFMLVDAKSMKGEQIRGFRAYFPKMIYTTAEKMRDLAGELMILKDSLPPMKSEPNQ